jgi:DNA topoisomerase-1
VSPLLSRALAGNRFEGLSAGRVQSVALRFLCDREAEITRFVPEEYWEIDLHLYNGEQFVASLTKKAGKKFVIRTGAQAEAVTSELREEKIVVDALTEKERRRQPSPPFITSSLQQAASSSLHFTPKRTMKVAQELYEGISLREGTVGLITYMRTDSLRTSDEAVAEARQMIVKQYGEKYLTPKARYFKNKKRSQDAHEAIRPTDMRRIPEAIASSLSPDQRKLYTLIYRRFLATQMLPAIYLQRKAILQAGIYTLEAGGSTLVFDGFLTLFPDQKAKEKAFPSDGFLTLFPDQKAKEKAFPSDLKEGEEVFLEKVETHQKFTEPPRRYSEAGLVNLLEKEGIGRPSTYASIVSVIQDRGYVVKENKR